MDKTKTALLKDCIVVLRNPSNPIMRSAQDFKRRSMPKDEQRRIAVTTIAGVVGIVIIFFAILHFTIPSKNNISISESYAGNQQLFSSSSSNMPHDQYSTNSTSGGSSK